MIYYRPEHYRVQELVDPDTYRDLGEQALILFRPELLAVADAIRDHFGRPVTINDWAVGGGLRYRGYRPPACTVGAKHSQHRLGAAIDFSVRGEIDEIVRAELVRLIHQQVEPFGWITGIEADTYGWVHVDLRNHNGLLIFKNTDAA